jgi:hypothetical protein
MQRLRSLIFGGDLGKYGNGNIRSLEDFMEYSGIDFINLTISSRDFLALSNLLL